MRHLIDWFPGFLAGGGIELPSAGSVDDDPVAAWASKKKLFNNFWDGPDAESEFTHPMAGGHRLADASTWATADVFMHTGISRPASVTPPTSTRVRRSSFCPGCSVSTDSGHRASTAGQWRSPPTPPPSRS